jgi:hypothetical protein
VSNLIDIDLQAYEPVEEPEDAQESASELEEVRSAGVTGTGAGAGTGAGIPPRSKVSLPHPPGPAGLSVPRTRLWIKRPPGPAGL